MYKMSHPSQNLIPAFSPDIIIFVGLEIKLKFLFNTFSIRHIYLETQEILSLYAMN
jgi:hypothetical protein